MTTAPTALSESDDPYVPTGYTGPIGRCELCGNPAPAVARTTSRRLECSPCWTGGVACSTFTAAETAALIRELRALTAKDYRAACQGALCPLAGANTDRRKHSD